VVVGDPVASQYPADRRLDPLVTDARHLGEGNNLRSGVSVNEARDVLWTYNAVELWDLLVNQRGWSQRRFGRWIGQQLIGALL
jgi:hypothetical protein